MKLERLNIHGPQSYEHWVGYRGDATFDGPLGKVQIHIGEELSATILRACADELVRASQHVAKELTTSIINQADSAAIEGPAQ